MRFSSLWCSINIIFLICYLYLVTQAMILISEEKDIIKKDSTVYNGLTYITIFEIVIIFLLFGKILIILQNRLQKIKEEELRIKIEYMEIFCFLPQIINFFILIAQISYYHSYKFVHKKELLKIKDFRIYCQVKIILVYIYSIWLLGSFLIFSTSLLCYSCGTCHLCLKHTGFFPDKIILLPAKMRNNKIYAV